MRTVTGRLAVGVETDGMPTYEDLEAVLGELQEIGGEYDVLLQAFDARYVAGEDHLRAALEHAERSMARGENVADDLAVETLCYAAGRRQIEEAMTMGLAAGEAEVIVLLAGERADRAAEAVRDLLDTGPVEPDEAVIMEFFGITPPERAASTQSLSALVEERVALLDVEK